MKIGGPGYKPAATGGEEVEAQPADHASEAKLEAFRALRRAIKGGVDDAEGVAALEAFYEACSAGE